MKNHKEQIKHLKKKLKESIRLLRLDLSIWKSENSSEAYAKLIEKIYSDS